MKAEVAAAVDELKRQFSLSVVTASEDGQGGAYLFIEPVSLGPRFKPDVTWAGFQITAQYPYADIYPVFIGHDVVRIDGVPFAPPVTSGHNFQGRPAIQVSRRNGAAQAGLQRATTKVLKVLHFLENFA